jgi:copper(I)-binding protein
MILAAAVVGLTLGGCSGRSGDGVTVEDARVQLPAVEGRPGVGYFELTTTRPVRITSVTSPRIGRIELHQTRETNGVTRMAKTDNVTFEHELSFAPGGRHAMLFGIDPSLAPGARVPLVFAFDQAPPVMVEAEVQAPGGGHSGH